MVNDTNGLRSVRFPGVAALAALLALAWGAPSRAQETVIYTPATSYVLNPGPVATVYANPVVRTEYVVPATTVVPTTTTVYPATVYAAPTTVVPATRVYVPTTTVVPATRVYVPTTVVYQRVRPRRVVVPRQVYYVYP